MAQPRVSSRAARSRGTIRPWLAALALAFGFASLATGCDLAGADIALAPASLSADFGTAPGTIPRLACSGSDASACMAVPAPTGVSGWQVGCDSAAGQCFGQADLRIQQVVASSDPSSFGSAAGRQAARYLESVDIAYTIPTNTLTFALAKIQLFAVQNPTTTSAPDGGVVVEQAPASPTDLLIGNVEALAPGQMVSDAHHLSLEKGSPAFAAISAQVQAGQDLALALVVTPRVVASAPLPAGAVSVVCQPTLHFALTWGELF
jgi:hypothetical protein